jgi:dihydroorotate dehydrogenase (NAD+) catalytic subunit
MADMNIDLGKISLKNPVLTASGTFGYGPEFEDFMEISRLGGIVVKGTTVEPRQGNPYPRMAETPSGMLNAVGLQNKGIDNFIKSIYPRISHYDTHIIVNVSGSQTDDYVTVARKLAPLDKISAIEVNISCPNVKQGGMAFGTSCALAEEVTSAVRSVYPGMMIVKLSPNVTDIAAIAKSVEGAGADAVSLINTLLGMAIDAESRKPVLSTVTGGLSGPCIKPVALRMVWQVSRAVKIPVIGTGGIMSGTDAIEFMLAGASAVQVGTASFIDPAASLKVMSGMEDYLERHRIRTAAEIIGALEV